MFPELNKSNIFSIEFYSKIIRFVAPLLKTINSNLASQLIKQEGELTKDEIGSIYHIMYNNLAESE